MRAWVVLGLVAAAVLGAGQGARAEEPIGLCVGGESGFYFGAGKVIAGNMPKDVPLRLETTGGSWEALGLVAEGKRCQAAIVQGDSIVAFTRSRGAEARRVRRASALHREYAHVLCNRKANISDAYDLMKLKKPVAVGPAEGGSGITFQNWGVANPDFAKVPALPEEGVIAAGMVGAGYDAVCMLFVSGLRSPLMKQLDAEWGKDLQLVEATGRLFTKSLDEQGQALYEMGKIPGGIYPKLAPSGGFMRSGDLEVPTVRALLVVNQEALNRKRHTSLIEAVGRSKAQILTDAGEK